jgi:flagellin
VTFDLASRSALAGTTVAPAVDNESVKLLGINKGSASTFDYGNIDDTTVSFTTTTASSSAATLVVNGTTFRATGVDLTSTGLKTIELLETSDGTTALTGTSRNSITVQFNLTGALTNNDTLTLELGQLGQVVGANQQTGASTAFSFKVGTGTSANDSIAFSLASATTSQLGISTSSISTAANADLAITALNTAITTVSSQRADIGANQSRLDFAAASINVAIENTTAAQSGLLDVDVSAEITEFTSQQVLLQAGVSLLAQANQQPALLLRLLQ